MSLVGRLFQVIQNLTHHSSTGTHCEATSVDVEQDGSEEKHEISFSKVFTYFSGASEVISVEGKSLV